MSKEFRSFLVRILLFVFLGMFVFFVIGCLLAFLALLFLFVMSFFVNDEYGILEFTFIKYYSGIAIVLSCYLTCKLFGVFIVMDRLKLNWFFQLCLLFLVEFCIVFVFLVFALLVSQPHEELTFQYLFGGFVPEDAYGYLFLTCLFISYFLYRFFALLTRLFPVPFERIGYYSSREFYKKVYKNIIKHNSKG